MAVRVDNTYISVIVGINVLFLFQLKVSLDAAIKFKFKLYKITMGINDEWVRTNPNPKGEENANWHATRVATPHCWEVLAETVNIKIKQIWVTQKQKKRTKRMTASSQAYTHTYKKFGTYTYVCI